MSPMAPPSIDETLLPSTPNKHNDEEMLVPQADIAEGPESTKVDSPTSKEDPEIARLTWKIYNFTRLNAKLLCSQDFSAKGYAWRIYILKTEGGDDLSLSIDVADPATMPYNWSINAWVRLTVINQIDATQSISKEEQRHFSARESPWSFVFMPLRELYDHHRGFLVNDTCMIEAEVARSVYDCRQNDSRKETGFVGLKNQGATCYMNSILQTLYHIPYFRKAVYCMPTTKTGTPSGTVSIPLALQTLFFKLQFSDTSVSTRKLTKSFGWDTSHSFIQHDVQEFNRILCENLENKMKGTVVESTIQQLFEGCSTNYIECIDVDCKSRKQETYYDLQLVIKGYPNVYASFDKYVEVERLKGDNKYHDEQFGLQDAKKFVLFNNFPSVLQLQLERFEYDKSRNTMAKINDRYEFPLQLDLDRENRKYLSSEAETSVCNLYTLHSVLVHSGDMNSGHYCAYIRPTLSDNWYKFDDERVTKVDTKEALEEQYGGDQVQHLQNTDPGFNVYPFKFARNSNAYMLVYVRESDKDKIICDVDENDMAEHRRVTLGKEIERKKEKTEAHLYTYIKVARDEDFLEQIGKHICFDLVDHDKVRSFRVQRQTQFILFKEEVAKEFGIPVLNQRFWLWAKRQNQTYRPNRPLTPQEEEQSVGQLKEVSSVANAAELKLFLEAEQTQDLRRVPPPQKSKEDILIFLKLYNPLKEELRFLGRLFVKISSKPEEICLKLNEMAGFDPNQDIDLYEELRFEPNVICPAVDKERTFSQNQIGDGDIICFQKSEAGTAKFPSFMRHLKDLQRMTSKKNVGPKQSDNVRPNQNRITFRKPAEKLQMNRMDTGLESTWID